MGRDYCGGLDEGLVNQEAGGRGGCQGLGPASNYSVCDRALLAQKGRPGSFVQPLPHQALCQTLCLELFILVIILQHGELQPTTHHTTLRTRPLVMLHALLRSQSREEADGWLKVVLSLSYLGALRSLGSQLPAGLTRSGA